jgi:hypothetical protein
MVCRALKTAQLHHRKDTHLIRRVSCGNIIECIRNRLTQGPSAERILYVPNASQTASINALLSEIMRTKLLSRDCSELPL